MKILIIHNYYQIRGGEDVYTDSLTKLLKKHGHKVYLYKEDSRAIKSLLDKIKTGLSLFWNFKTEKELTKVIKKFKPDIAHFNNIYPLIGVTAYIVCKKNNLPIIQTIHNYRFMCPKGILFRNKKICEDCVDKKLSFPAVLHGCYHQSRLASFFFSFSFYFYKYILNTFKSINFYIFPNQFTRDYYIKNLRIPNVRTIVLPYFVETYPITQLKREDYFLFVGKLAEEKGILELLEIIKTLPKVKLKVIGTGPFKKEVNQYKSYKNIEILGFVPNIKTQSYIKKAKGMIIPSLWYETGPFVYLEALRSNTPVFYRQQKTVLEKKELIFFLQNVDKFKKDSKLSKKYTQEYHYKKIINLYLKKL